MLLGELAHACSAGVFRMVNQLHKILAAFALGRAVIGADDPIFNSRHAKPTHRILVIMISDALQKRIMGNVVVLFTA